MSINASSPPTVAQSVFHYQNNPIRAIIDGKGNPWFIAKDVCDILGYSNPTQTLLDHLDDDEKAIVSIGLPGPGTNIISESGLFTLIIRSNKKQARIFRKWVTSEVLPTIRKTGGYRKLPPLEIPDDLDQARALFDHTMTLLEENESEARYLRKILKGCGATFRRGAPLYVPPPSPQMALPGMNGGEA